MHSTKTARSLKNLFAGYHEPIPLSKKKSQKLLNGLKSSFRDQLDREYGRSPSSASAAAKTPHTPSPRHPAANQHLKTLLSNPLFSYEKETTSTLPDPSPLPKRDPMDVFDHAVSRGMMTLKAAAGCLVAKQQQQQLLEADTAPQNTDSGLRVIRWLRSSRSHRDMDFLDSRPFVRALVPFLVAEGLDHVAWEWVARSIGDAPGTPDQESHRQRAFFLLAELVRVRSQPQNGNLDAAIATLLQAESNFHSSPLLSQMLISPWRTISWLSTVESYRRTPPSEGLFDAHVKTARSLQPSLDVEKAHLHLYHPTNPDHTPALRLFEDTEKVRRILKNMTPDKAGPGKAGAMGLLQWTAVLGHDTVNFLTRSGRSQEAEHLTGLLQYELASLFIQGLKPA